MRFLRSLFWRNAASVNFRSGSYWVRRYETGGTSGSGSYGRLAEYKAGVINSLAREWAVRSVVEFGSGDGNQCSLLDIDSYLGVDISPAVIAACRARFVDRPGWTFLTLDDWKAAPRVADMAMSLDVIYHLVEDDVFGDYMARLFDAADRFVLIYSSDAEMPSRAHHVRHRRYSDWITAVRPDFALLQSFNHPYPMTERSDPKQTSFAHFKLFGRCDAAPLEGSA